MLFVYGEAFSQTIDDKGMTLKKTGTISPLFTKDTMSIVFGGDFMMHKAQIDNSFCDGRHSFDGSFSAEVLDIISKADLAVGNMEFTLGGPPYTGYPTFSAPETYPEYLTDRGMDVLLLANNHILDKGTAGIDRTMKYYRKMREAKKIWFTGCDTDNDSFEDTNPLYLRLSGIKVAFINFTYGTNLYGNARISRMSKEHLQRLFSKAHHDGAEIIIALPHWGEEYSLKASANQKEWAQWLADQGADIIIGSHPHVVQEAGEIHTASGKTVPVIYSLGNAISNMSAENTRIGLLVTLRLTRNIDGKAETLAPEYTYTWCTLPGRLTDRHTTIAVKEYEGKREKWAMPHDYDNMIRTYMHVKETVGIKD